jgi:hydrogenase-4 component B
VLEQLAPRAGGEELKALWTMGIMTLVLALIVTAAVAWGRRSLTVRTAPTWGCGYARPDGRMQYTASSFAQMLLGLFGGLLPRRAEEVRLTGPFPAPARFESHVEDAVLDRVLTPLWRRLQNGLEGLRVMQQGSVQAYLLYILLTLLALLATALPLSDMLSRLLLGVTP